MQTSTRRSVIGIVFNSTKDEIVLLKRRDVPIWVLPGGGVEATESPEEAAIREVFEETGLHVRICRHVAHYTPINRLSNNTYVYECEIVAGTLTTGEETREVGFYSSKQLPQPCFFLHQEWIADAEKNLATPITKALTQVTYWRLFKYFCVHPLQVLRLLLSRIGSPINSP